MRKCPRCAIVFHLDTRTRCLYCDSLLLTVDRDDTVGFDQDAGVKGFKASQPVVRSFLKDRKIEEHGRVHYMVGTYFKSRTFGFMYRFSRKEFKMGRGYSRLLIQPLHLTSFLMLPWTVWNLIDSLLFRILYNGYCERCGSKYIKTTTQSPCSQEQCEYNREFTSIIDDIMTGDVTHSERRYKFQAMQKIKAGKRCAYYDLCARQGGLSTIADILCIWFSIALLISLAVFLTFPVFMHGVDFLMKENRS